MVGSSAHIIRYIFVKHDMSKGRAIIVDYNPIEANLKEVFVRSKAYNNKKGGDTDKDVIHCILD